MVIPVPYRAAPESYPIVIWQLCGDLLPTYCEMLCSRSPSSVGEHFFSAKLGETQKGA